MKRRLSLRGRMVVTAVVATAVVLAVLLIWASPTLERRARDDAFGTLTAQAWLMARVAEEGFARSVSEDELDRQVDAAAREVDARVTIVAPDGRVLADSALSGADLRAVENHGGRPEVKGALAGQPSAPSGAAPPWRSCSTRRC
jgi:two-component system phosphate regulon sensor histidine kinase PhoR